MAKTKNTHHEEEDDFEDGKEVESNWFKFEEVGDKIKGTLMGKRLQKSTNSTFPDQWVYELKKSDGHVYMVGIAVNKPGTVQRLNNCKVGEIIGILFEKEGEQKTKGFAKPKFLKVVTFGMDESYKEFADDGSSHTNPSLPSFNEDGE